MRVRSNTRQRHTHARTLERTKQLLARSVTSQSSKMICASPAFSNADQMFAMMALTLAAAFFSADASTPTVANNEPSKLNNLRERDLCESDAQHKSERRLRRIAHGRFDAAAVALT